MSSLEGFRPPSIVCHLTGRVLTITLLLLDPVTVICSLNLELSKMKRKDTTPPQKPNPSKKTKKTKKNNPQTQLVDVPVDVVETKPCDQKETASGIVSEEGPWKNLELILSLQNNELSNKE